MIALKSWGIIAIVMSIIMIVIPIICVEKFQDRSKMEKDQIWDGKPVKILITEKNKLCELSFEEYVKGVVYAEMPAEFEIEALKAQAVAARTYAYGRIIKKYKSKDSSHPDADICSDSTHCQAWKNFDDAFNSKGKNEVKKLKEKISRAVELTKGEILEYKGEVANPLFHSNSGGVTADALEVFGADVPYLKSVFSPGEDVSSEFLTTKYFTWKVLGEKITNSYPGIKMSKEYDGKNFEILEKSKSGRVLKMQVGTQILKGTDVRKMLGLNSTMFDVLQNKSGLEIKVRGYGHGVGMSQWGANNLAKEGKNHHEILTYYYTGIGFEKIKQ